MGRDLGDGTIGAMDAASPAGRRNRADRREQGVGMLATLLTVIILGVMVTVALNSLDKKPSSSGPTTTIPGETTTTVPSTAKTGAQEAAVSACQTDYAALETSLGEYRALNGTSPAAGTAWATSSSNGGPYLQVWPESAPYFRITWNGAVLGVIPVRGAASSGNDGSSTAKTGCFGA
jgi:hypothetical protein